MTDRPEGTFELLRYSLGGNRPSQTDRQAVSPARFHGTGLELSHTKGGISPLAPSGPKPRLQRLPPILRMTCESPMPDYSKAA
jgi:hypothetical protein